MKIKIQITKKNITPLLIGLFVIAGAIAVIAFGTSNPAVLGHTADEVANISAAFSVPIAELKGFNSAAEVSCVPNWPDATTKFATPGTISACSRYCQTKGYNSGTFIECDGNPQQTVMCSCIN